MRCWSVAFGISVVCSVSWSLPAAGRRCAARMRHAPPPPFSSAYNLDLVWLVLLLSNGRRAHPRSVSQWEIADVVRFSVRIFGGK
jgi:hypothetical protein